MSKRQSPIWDYFTVAEDTIVASCKVCCETISRDGKQACNELILFGPARNWV